jgi:hypothetical protein
MPRDVIEVFISWKGRLRRHEKLDLEHTYSLHYGEILAGEK